jgi:hypothetical protein
MKSFVYLLTGDTNDARLQGEQNLKMTIQQYIEGQNCPVCLRMYQALEIKLESA